MEKIVTYLGQEWAVVSAAPATFFTLAVLMFTLSRAWHREVITRLKEQKQIRDDDLSDLKARTGLRDLKSLIDRIATIERELKETGQNDLAGIFTRGLKISDLPPLP